MKHTSNAYERVSHKIKWCVSQFANLLYFCLVDTQKFHKEHDYVCTHLYCLNGWTVICESLT